MYLHLGEEVVVLESDIVGIFDLEKCSLSKDTRAFLSSSTKNKRVINVSYEMPKSFIITNNNVYISQISTQTLKKRLSK